ncbi:unnamed protein product [Zymoseptoria tritici ST99CH_3D1]|nr:unnamed protein product [Zymoseptoria tritici ST99CH_3D1]
MCASNAVDTCGKIGSECAPFTIGPSGMDCCDEFACKQVGDSEVYKCALPSASCIQDGDQCSLSSTCCGDSSTCQPDGALGNLVCKSTTSQPSCGDSGSQCGNAGQPDCCGGLQCQLPAGASDAVCLAPAPTCSANQFTCGSTCCTNGQTCSSGSCVSPPAPQCVQDAIVPGPITVTCTYTQKCGAGLLNGSGASSSSTKDTEALCFAACDDLNRNFRDKVESTPGCKGYYYSTTKECALFKEYSNIVSGPANAAVLDSCTAPVLCSSATNPNNPDYDNDKNACGSCSNKCPDGNICSGGSCVTPPATCPANQTPCGSTCCGQGESCNGSSCFCPTSADKDYSDDFYNCNFCGNRCPDGAYCAGTVCYTDG